MLTLVTIPVSHYCEKARWGLDLAGLAYREDGNLPLFHVLRTRPRGGTSVPLLVTPERTLTDSSDILAWLAPTISIYPDDASERSEALALEDHFDVVLGPHTRRAGYALVLPQRELALGIIDQRTARWQTRLARPTFPLLAQVMKRLLKITPTSAARSLDVVRRVCGEVDARLAAGRRYLVGTRFSVADLTFAALMSPLLLPPEHPIAWPARDALPTAWRSLVDELRATLAGQHALRMYREHRAAQVSSRTSTK